MKWSIARLGNSGRPIGRGRSRAAVRSGVAAFVLGTLALNALLDTTRSRYRDPEFAWHARHTAKRQSQHPRRPLGIVLGTSRPHVGFDPSELGLPEGDDDAPIVANFAQTGSVPVYSLMNLHRILALGWRPAFVLFEIMPVELVADIPAEKLIPAQRMSFADSVAIEDHCGTPTAWLAPRIAPWQTYRTNILSHHTGSWLPEDGNPSWLWTRPNPSGWLPIGFDTIPQSRRDTYMATVRASYAQAFTDFAIGARSDRAVRELLRLCADHGIPCIGFRMPESPIFRSWYPRDARGKIDAYLAGLRRDFDFECFDCSEWLEEEDFLDGHHLLQPGAAKFSRRFGS